MNLKPLVISSYSILGVVERGVCDANLFLTTGEANEEKYRSGLLIKLRFLADRGLANTSVAWSHEADKQNHIYEFSHGPLRLFYFKGINGQIAICTGGTRKKGRRADPKCVARAIRMRRDYFAAVEAGTLMVEDNDEIE